MLTADLAGAETLAVDLHFLARLGDVRDINLDGAVAQGLHEFVGEELFKLGLVGMPDDYLVDVGLGEFFGFNKVFLRGHQEVVEKGYIELENLDKLDNHTVG